MLRIFWAVPVWAVVNTALFLALDFLLLLARHSHEVFCLVPNADEYCLGRVTYSIQHFFNPSIWDTPEGFDRLTELWQLGIFVLPLGLLYFSLLSGAAARSALRPSRWRTFFLDFGRDETRIAVIFLQYILSAVVVFVSLAALSFVILVAVDIAWGRAALDFLTGLLFALIVPAAFLVAWPFFSLAVPIAVDQPVGMAAARSFALTRGRRLRLFVIYSLSVLLGVVVAVLIGLLAAVALDGLLAMFDLVPRPGSQTAAVQEITGTFPFALLFVDQPPKLADLITPVNLLGLVVQSLMLSIFAVFTTTPMVRAYQALHPES
ncbi:MAG TPA: hypothetical protein VGG48_06710 [Rhizomicrobium sp.]